MLGWPVDWAKAEPAKAPQRTNTSRADFRAVWRTKLEVVWVFIFGSLSFFGGPGEGRIGSRRRSDDRLVDASLLANLPATAPAKLTCGHRR